MRFGWSVMVASSDIRMLYYLCSQERQRVLWYARSAMIRAIIFDLDGAADIFNVGELMGEAEAAIRASVEARIRLFGSEGKGL